MQVPPKKERLWHDKPLNSYNPWHNPMDFKFTSRFDDSINSIDSNEGPEISFLSLEDEDINFKSSSPTRRSVNPFIEEDLGLVIDRLDNLTIRDNQGSYLLPILILMILCIIFYYFEDVALKLCIYSIFLASVAFIIDKIITQRNPALTSRQLEIQRMSRTCF